MNYFVYKINIFNLIQYIFNKKTILIFLNKEKKISLYHQYGNTN